jgi:acyl-CoA synthetase (NDP forming)
MRIFRDAGVVVVRSIEVAAACLAGIEQYHQVLLRKAEEPAAVTPQPKPEATAIIEAVQADGRTSLLEPEALRLLAASGVRVPPFAVVADAAGVAALPMALTAVPAAIKIVSEDILHKSDVGGVALNLDGPRAVELAAAAMIERVKAKRPDAVIAGFLVQEMIRRPDAHELILGVSEDRQFGPAILFGNHCGSTYTVEGAMLATAIMRRYGVDHPLYFLAHRAFYALPGLGPWLPTVGAVLAANTAARAQRSESEDTRLRAQLAFVVR